MDVESKKILLEESDKVVTVKINPNLTMVRPPERGQGWFSKSKKFFQEVVTLRKKIIKAYKDFSADPNPEKYLWLKTKAFVFAIWRRMPWVKKEDKMPPMLRQYTVNLTDLARSGELDEIVGREREINVILNTLCRRNKRNSALLGPAGVGKTAIVEGLANFLCNKTIQNA